MKTKILLLSVLSGFISILTSCYRLKLTWRNIVLPLKSSLTALYPPIPLFRRALPAPIFSQIWTISNLNTMAGTGKQKFQV